MIEDGEKTLKANDTQTTPKNRAKHGKTIIMFKKLATLYVVELFKHFTS